MTGNYGVGQVLSPFPSPPEDRYAVGSLNPVLSCRAATFANSHTFVKCLAIEACLNSASPAEGTAIASLSAPFSRVPDYLVRPEFF
jgi:hypothetical protein